MADLLVSLGLATDDALDVVQNTQLPSDEEVLLVLKQASSAGELGKTGTAGSAAISSDSAVGSAAHGNDADDDVPLYSRVTDDLITGGLPMPPVPPISGFGGWLTGDGGKGGNGGGGHNGRGSSDDFMDGFPWRGRWNEICQALVEMLPVGLAISLMLPPAALHRLMSSLLTALFPSSRHFLRGKRPCYRPLGLPALMLSPRTLSSACVPFDDGPATSNLSRPLTWGTEVMDWDVSSATAFLHAWPASWLPNDAACSGSSGSCDPTAWLRSAAGPPLPKSALSAVNWLSRLGASPQELARKVELLAVEAKAAREVEARAACRIVVATALAKIVAEARFEEKQADRCSQAPEISHGGGAPPVTQAVMDTVRSSSCPLDYAMPDVTLLTSDASPGITSSPSIASLRDVISLQESCCSGDGVVMLTLKVPKSQIDIHVSHQRQDHTLSVVYPYSDD